ncbi:MAG TPA: class I SAM-dependent methyltransferase [Candidatus Eremiobacteraeota bacterium]|nr:class I SAM-dependent methyltransferase [Candidatus Eremiobacteraeota bacterium]
MNLNFYCAAFQEILRQFLFTKSDYDFVFTFTGITRQAFKEFRRDLYGDEIFFTYIEKKYYTVRKKRISLKRYEIWNFLLYYLIRSLNPETVIETGVFDGITTSFLLKALKENNKGHLYSIDLPAYEKIDGSTHKMKFTTLPGGEDVGWIIPPGLRDRWTLYKGPSNLHLKPLLNKLKVIDLFLHDSLHTYENMMYEYETVWPYLRQGGILSSDDILWNPSFHDFSKKVKRSYSGKYRFGVLKK